MKLDIIWAEQGAAALGYDLISFQGFPSPLLSATPHPRRVLDCVHWPSSWHGPGRDVARWHNALQCIFLDSEISIFLLQRIFPPLMLGKAAEFWRTHGHSVYCVCIVYYEPSTKTWPCYWHYLNRVRTRYFSKKWHFPSFILCASVTQYIRK